MIVIAAPIIPMKAESIKALRRPYLTRLPESAAEIINVIVEQLPIMLSFTVSSLPLQSNFASSAGVI